MIVAVSPGWAWVVSIKTTPLSLVVDKLVDVIVIGLTGSELASPVIGLFMIGTWVISASVLVPVSIWPKTV